MSWEGFLARAWTILHKILHPTHIIIWKDGPAPEIGCAGDIICETCDMLIWCRSYDLSDKEQEEIYQKYKDEIQTKKESKVTVVSLMSEQQD